MGPNARQSAAASAVYFCPQRRHGAISTVGISRCTPVQQLVKL